MAWTVPGSIELNVPPLIGGILRRRHRAQEGVVGLFINGQVLVLRHDVCPFLQPRFARPGKG
jgi:hypothetical protein